MKDQSSIKGILKAMGPGILFAGAAIGGSHLIQSTRAGAIYGFELLWIVILINLFKYPFFEYGHRYTAATGKSLIEGYAELGKYTVILFLFLSFVTAIVNFSAVTMVTAGILQYLLGVNLNNFTLSSMIIGSVIVLLLIGKYPLLDKSVKIIIIVLAISTFTAFLLAFANGSQVAPDYEHPAIWDSVGIAFLIALMGWMPAPIEASVWPSLWALERNKQTNYTPKFREALVDFHIGYIGTTVMAVFFLGLGAYLMYGTGKVFSPEGVMFSAQLVNLYTTTLGEWSKPIIAITVLITMFSTSITVIDAYPRTLEGSMLMLMKPSLSRGRKLYWFWLIFLSALAVIIIGWFAKNMATLLDFATIVSFLAAPVFAYINYRVVTSKSTPKEYQPKLWLKILSILGLVFFFLFCILFIVTRFDIIKL